MNFGSSHFGPQREALQFVAADHKLTMDNFSPKKNGGIAIGGGEVGGLAMGGDMEGSTDAISTAEQWLSACVADDWLHHPLIREKLLVCRTTTCQPCIYSGLKQDSCRNDVDCAQAFLTLDYHPGVNPAAEAKARQCTAALYEARPAARRSKAYIDRPRARQRDQEILGWLMRSIENGLHAEDLPTRAHALPNTGDQPARENKSPETGPVSSSGDGDRVKPDIQELLWEYHPSDGHESS